MKATESPSMELAPPGTEQVDSVWLAQLRREYLQYGKASRALAVDNRGLRAEVHRLNLMLQAQGYRLEQALDRGDKLTGENQQLREARDLPAVAPMHLNSADDLPPVDCPLLIEVAPGEVKRAHRTAFIASTERTMTYQTTEGEQLSGRFRWTYP